MGKETQSGPQEYSDTHSGQRPGECRFWGWGEVELSVGSWHASLRGFLFQCLGLCPWVQTFRVTIGLFRPF